MSSQRRQLLKKLLPGFIPLFVFIAVDEIWGTKAGLIAALAIGSLELLWIAVRENRFDRFVLFDTLLLLVFNAAFYLSSQTWAFISGGLFYILFGVVFAVEFLRQTKAQQKAQKTLDEEEQLPLVNEAGQVIGKASRSVCHNGQKLLHPVVHLHVLNNKNALYLQKRPMNKLVQPGKWDTAVGGHVAFGEAVQLSLQREAWEEIGLKDFSAKLIKQYIWESELEREIVYVFVTHDFQGIQLHSEEVEEGRFWTENQVVKNLGKGIFTPNFEHEFKLLFNRSAHSTIKF